MELGRIQRQPHLLELLSQGVRIRGTAITHVRVSDMLNENDIWMDMTSVELWSIPADEGSDPERHDNARIRKSAIEVVAEISESHPLHAGEIGYHVNKTPRRILCLTANFAIRADLHVTNQADIEQTLDVFRGRFLPLTTASCVPTTRDRSEGSFSRKFVAVNLDKVNLICDAAEAPPVFFPD